MTERPRVLVELGVELDRAAQRRLNGRRTPGVRRFAGGARRPVRLEHLAVVASLLVVIAVGAVFIGTGGSGSAGSAAGDRAVTIVFSVSPLDPATPLGPSLGRSITVLRQRLDSVFRGVEVNRAGDSVVVGVRAAAGVSRARIVSLAVPARLGFYDWEADALTPNGKTVASQLRTQDPAAIAISQGSGTGAPGNPGAGGVPLYDAVKLASKQPAAPTTPTLGRLGPQYYMFGAPGSQACAAAAKFYATTLTAGVHCLLSGPDTDVTDLRSGLPIGVTAAEGQQIVVPQGTVVLQASNPSATDQIKFKSPSAQFYVLRDHVSLTGSDITNPQPSTDSAGSPDVRFGLDSTGQATFTKVTGEIARRGDSVSSGSQTLNQHFAVALDQQLITVPSIDFKVYPDGITGGGGADLSGDFTTQSARTVATLLRYRALTVELVTH